MADNGTIRTLYEDKEKTKPIYPRTVASAVSSSNGLDVQSELNLKQDIINDLATIRSGAALGATAIQEIKTINNTSLEGIGNIQVQPTLVSGTNIKTINGASILGSGDISPIATSSDLGQVKIGDGINVTTDGTISTQSYSLPIASSTVLGGVKIGDGINISNGAISAAKYANATTTTDGLMSSTDKTKLDELEKDNASTEIILPTGWTLDSTTNYYTQNVAVTGMLSTDMPTLSVKLSGTADEMRTISKEWGKILTAETYDGGIKFYAGSATTQDLTVIIKGALAKVKVGEMTEAEAVEYFSATFATKAYVDEQISAQIGTAINANY